MSRNQCVTDETPSTLRALQSTLALGLALILVLGARPAGQTHSGPSAADAMNSRPIGAGSVVERELSAAQSHAYLVTLAAGQFLLVTIEQRGVDLAATLARPDGSEVVAIDAMDDGFRPETVVATADVDGVYTLSVRRSPSAKTDGRYAIRVDALRPAAADDALRVAAERAFARGRKTMPICWS